MSHEDRNEKASVSERILRLQDEWDEIAELPSEVGLTQAQLEELERRLRDHRMNQRKYRTWEQLRAELEASNRDED